MTWERTPPATEMMMTYSRLFHQLANIWYTEFVWHVIIIIQPSFITCLCWTWTVFSFHLGVIIFAEALNATWFCIIHFNSSSHLQWLHLCERGVVVVVLHLSLLSWTLPLNFHTDWNPPASQASCRWLFCSFRNATNTHETEHGGWTRREFIGPPWFVKVSWPSLIAN